MLTKLTMYLSPLFGSSILLQASEVISQITGAPHWVVESGAMGIVALVVWRMFWYELPAWREAQKESQEEFSRQLGMERKFHREREDKREVLFRKSAQTMMQVAREDNLAIITSFEKLTQAHENLSTLVLKQIEKFDRETTKS